MIMKVENIECWQFEHGSPEYWASVKLRYDVLRVPLGLDYGYSQLLAESEDYHLAAYQDGKLLACLILSPAVNGQIKMRQVAVDNGFQRKGIGNALVAFSESFAIAKGFHEMRLHARETAIPFYLSLGYEVYDELFMEVTIPHRKMKKRLGK